MLIAVSLARIFLSLVFFLSGVTKLADRNGSREAVMAFGLPERFAPLGSLLLPLVELAIAIALLPGVTAVWASVAAVLLLLVFIGGIAYTLSQGKRPDCHCFGQLYSEPIGAQTIARNLVLVAVASFALAAGMHSPGFDATGWLVGLSNAQRFGVVVGVMVVALMAAQLWMLFRLWAVNGQVLARLNAPQERATPLETAAPEAETAAPDGSAGLPVGSPAPRFDLPNLDGVSVSLDRLLEAQRAVLLVFTDPQCGPCSTLLPDLARWQHDYEDVLSVVSVSRKSAAENRGKAEEHGLQTVLLQSDFEIAEAYDAKGTPSAVIVHPTGVIGSPVAIGTDGVRGLVGQFVTVLDEPMASPTEAQAGSSPVTPGLGMPAPSVELMDLSGRSVPLREFTGRDTVLLFWNTGCGYCQQMLSDLRAWEEYPPANAPHLIVVVPGASGNAQILPFISDVMIDRDGSVAGALGANGTPMAVRLSKTGTIASGVAAGAAEVFQLLGASSASLEPSPA